MLKTSPKCSTAADRYQEHVDRLSREMGCRLVQAPGLNGMHFVEFGFVEGPTITNQVEYLTVLHELGHFAHGHTQGRPVSNRTGFVYNMGMVERYGTQFYFENGVLRSEAQAWEWALDHCLDAPTREARGFIGSQRGNLGLQAEEEPLSSVVVVV